MPPSRRQRLGDLACAGLLLVVVVLFWGDCLWGGKVPVAGVYQQQMRPWSAQAAVGGPQRQWDSLLWDSVAQFYPWRLLLHRAARSGELPLWNPYQFHGYPFVGNGQSAIFYPPNWLYFIIHPRLGMGLSAALHYFLGAVFAFGLARTLGLVRPAALFAALAFAFGGFLVTWIELPTLVNSLIWLPLAWWGIEVIFRGGRARGAVMLATALGMTLLAGHLQIAAYVWIFAAVYGLARPLERKVSLSRIERVIAREGDRALDGPSPETVRRWYYRAPAGWVAAAFALGGMLGLAQVLPTLELGALSPRGGGGPSAAGFEFHRQRAPRPAELLTFLQPDFLGSPAKGDYPGISYSEHCGFVGAGTLALALAGLGLARRSKHMWLFAGMAVFALWAAMGGPPAMLLYWGVPKLGQAGGFSRLLSVWTLAAALWGGIGLDSLMRKASGSETPHTRVGAVVGGLALALLMVELLPWAHRFNPRLEAGRLYPETPLVLELQRTVGSGRYMGVTPRAAWRLDKVPTEAVLPPNAGTAYGLRGVDGYDSLFTASYRDYAARVEGADPAPAANGNMLLLENGLAWATEVDCVVTPEEAPFALPGARQVLDGCVLQVTRGPTTGRACLVAKASPAGLRGDEAAGRRPLRIGPEGLNSVTIEVPDSAGGTLVLRDEPYPGWRAFVNGQPAAMSGSPGSRLVDVPAGPSRVDMVYYPATVVAGLFVGLCALAALAGLATARGLRGAEHD